MGLMRRPRFRFSLRTLFVVVTVVGIITGQWMVISRLRAQVMKLERTAGKLETQMRTSEQKRKIAERRASEALEMGERMPPIK